MTETRTPAVPDTRYDDPRLSNAMRVINAYMRASAQWLIVPEFDALYTEPMYLALSSEPAAIICGRVRGVAALEFPIDAGGPVPFVWDGARKRAAISLIRGMTPFAGASVTFRFSFFVVGALP